MKQLFSGIVSSVILFVYFLAGGPSATADQSANTNTVKQAGMQPPKKITVKADTATLAGNWVLQPVLASDTASGKIPTVSFDLTKNKFTGFTGCNRMSGSFMAKGNTLAINHQLILTKMFCEGYNEKEFITNLLRVNSFKIEGGVLQLMIDKTPISKWVRKTDNKLVAKL